MPRDGRFIESLGYYNPVADPAVVHVDEESVFKWLGNGAQASESAASLLRREGYLQKWELMKQGLSGAELDNRIEAIRNQRQAAMEQKEAAKKSEKSAKAKAKDAAAEKSAAEAPAEKPAEAPAEEKAEAAVEPAEEAKSEPAAEEAAEGEAAADESKDA